MIAGNMFYNRQYFICIQGVLPFEPFNLAAVCAKSSDESSIKITFIHMCDSRPRSSFRAAPTSPHRSSVCHLNYTRGQMYDIFMSHVVGTKIIFVPLIPNAEFPTSHPTVCKKIAWQMRVCVYGLAISPAPINGESIN